MKENNLKTNEISKRKDDFYAPAYYDVGKEYRKYSQMVQDGKKDKTIFFRLGKINHYWGNHDKAVRFYKKALKEDGNYGEVHYNLGNIYFLQNKLNKSIEHYEKAIKKNPGDVYALNAIGKTYLRLSKFEKALEHHKKALKTNPEDLYALRGMGNIYMVQYDFGKALNYYYKALEINPSDGITLYNTGLIHILSGRLEEGEKHYKEKLEKYDFYGFYMALGLISYQKGEKEEAYEFYRKGIEKEVVSELNILFNLKLKELEWNRLVAIHHFCKAKALYSLNRQNEAIEEMETAIEINPEFTDAYRFLGKFCYEKGDYLSAMSYYEDLLETGEAGPEILREIYELRLLLNPKDLNSLKKLQHIYWLSEDFDKEIEVLEKITKASEEGVYFYQLGSAYLAKNEKEKAENAFNKILTLEEKEDLAYFGFSGLYNSKNDYGTALQYIKKALKAKNIREYHLAAGNIYEKTDKYKNALNHYIEAFKLAPYCRMTHRHYIDCLLNKKNKEVNIEAISELKNMAGYRLILSLFYITLAEYDKAQKSLREIELSSENKGLYHLYSGISYLEKGYFEKALEDFTSSHLYDELKGEAGGLMAITYYKMGRKDKFIETLKKLNFILKLTGPVLRSILCSLMLKENFIKELEPILLKTVKSLNLYNQFSSPSEKNNAEKKLDGIVKIIKEISEEDIPPALKDIIKVEKKKETDRAEMAEEKAGPAQKIAYICRTTGISPEEAKQFLKENKGDEIEAVINIKREIQEKIDYICRETGVSREEGKKALKESKGNKEDGVLKIKEKKKKLQKITKDEKEGKKIKLISDVKKYIGKYEEKIDYIMRVAIVTEEVARKTLEESQGNEEEAIAKIKQLTENKIDYICNKTGVSPEEARKALKEEKGDKLAAVKIIKKSSLKSEKKNLPEEKKVADSYKKKFTTSQYAKESLAAYPKKELYQIMEKEDYVSPDSLLSIDIISVELGRSLLPFIDPNQGARLMERIKTIKKHIAMESGIIVPNIKFKENSFLKPESYIINIKNVAAGAGEVLPGRYMAIGEKANIDFLSGPSCQDPTYGMPAVWIKAEERESAEEAGCMIFDALSVMTTQITEVIRLYGAELVTSEATKKILERVRKTHPDVVNEIYPSIFNIGAIQKILKNLIGENIPVRNIITILEAIGDYGHITRDTDIITEYVRQSLCRVICREYEDEEGTLNVIRLSPALEEFILNGLKKEDYSIFMPSQKKKLILKAFEEKINYSKEMKKQPVILCSPSIRLCVKKLTEKSFPYTAVISFKEVAPGVNIKTLSTVEFSENIEEESILYYVKKLLKDKDEFIRCEGIKSLVNLAGKNNLKEIYSYIKKGLKDKNKKVRLESAVAVRELCSKNLIP